MALTQSKSVDILAKKFIWGKSATEEGKEYFEEQYPSNYPILSSDIWLQSDELPNTAATVSSVLNLVTATLSWIDGTKGSYVNTNLKNAVPASFGDGISYKWNLYRNDGLTEISVGEGDWLFDNGSGVLNFMAATGNSGLVYNQNGVIIASASAPPVMTVWKYIGKLGSTPQIGSGLTYSGGVLSAVLDGGSENLQQTLAIGNSMGTYSIIMNTGKLQSTGLTSSISLSDVEITISSPQLKIQNPELVFTDSDNWILKEISATGNGTFSMTTLSSSSFGSSDFILSVQAIVQGWDIFNNYYYSGNLFAFFSCVGGTFSQVGTTDKVEKRTAIAGKMDAEIEALGTDVLISVSGNNISADVRWSGKINYIATF